MNKFSYIFLFFLFVPFISQAYYYWERSPNGSEFSQLREIGEYYGNSVSYHLISTEDWEVINKAKDSVCEDNYYNFLRNMRNLDEEYPYVGGFPNQSSQNQAQQDLLEGRVSAVDRSVNNIEACFARNEEDEEDETLELRQEEIATALQNCDFNFFAEMTSQEKMDTFDERKACEEEADKPEPEPVEVVPISVPVPEPIVVEPVVPTYVPPAPVEQVVPVTEPEAEVIVEEIPTSTPTTTEETIELTQEELDRLVEEKLNEKLEEVEPEPAPQPEEKPSFFKRVTNFLFGWMF